MKKKLTRIVLFVMILSLCGGLLVSASGDHSIYWCTTCNNGIKNFQHDFNGTTGSSYCPIHEDCKISYTTHTNVFRCQNVPCLDYDYKTNITGEVHEPL